MALFQTVNPVASCSTPNVTDTVLPDKASSNFYPFKEEKWAKPNAFIKRPRQHRGVLKMQRKTWVPLLSCIFALVALLTSCFRAGRIGTLSFKSTNKNTANGRRLAHSGGQPKHADDEEAKILELCLDLEEAAGSVNSFFPPTQNEAVPLILQFLNDPSLQSPQQQPEAIRQAGAGTPLFSAPSILTASAPCPQPGPPRVGPTAGWWGPVYSSPSCRHEALSPQESGVPLWQAFRNPLPLLQAQQEQEKGPGECGPASNKPATAAKRGTDQREPGEPPPKKHTSGWKREQPAPVSAARSSQRQQQGVGFGDESTECDPLLRAIQAVREEYSPPPLSIPESLGETAEEPDRILEPGDSVSLMPHTSSLQLYFPRETPPTLSRSEGEGDVRGPFLLDSPSPSTSQGRRALPVLPQKDPLPGPSGGSLFSAIPLHRSGGESEEVQQQAAAASQPAAPLAGGPSAAPQRLPGTAHLFYRLPVLLPGQHMLKRFDAARAFSKANTLTKGLLPLDIMRSILTQPAITADNAACLIRQSEAVAGRVLHELQAPLDPLMPGRVIYRLGRIFLLLDALISTIYVLRPVMNLDEWWPTIARNIPPHRVYSSGARRLKVANIHAAFATDLSSALQVMRNCVRLPERETILLKRRLFCSGDTIADFKHQRWNAWREDDEKSRCSLGDGVSADRSLEGTSHL